MLETGIERIDLDVASMKTISAAKRGASLVRLTRTGKGSISEERIEHTSQISKLLDTAYEKAREAAKNK